MYNAISQPHFNYKILTFPSTCDLEMELPPILLEIYKRNIDLEFTDNKLTRKRILKNISLSIKKMVTFDLPPIEEEKEEKMDHYKSALRILLHPKLQPYLTNPWGPNN